jgi:hypothetical protein
VSLVNAIYHCRQYYPIDTALLERFDRAFNDVGEKAAAREGRDWPAILSSLEPIGSRLRVISGNRCLVGGLLRRASLDKQVPPHALWDDGGVDVVLPLESATASASHVLKSACSAARSLALRLLGMADRITAPRRPMARSRRPPPTCCPFALTVARLFTPIRGLAGCQSHLEFPYARIGTVPIHL